MQAQILHELKTSLKRETLPDLEPGKDEVIVELRAAALNRRDYWITQGMYPGIRLPMVLGSDGAGRVARIGDGVPHHWSGKEVVINPGLNWGPRAAAQGNDFRILGMPDYGTFADAVRVPASALAPKPEHLSWEEAAALPLSGVTAYRALVTQGQVQAGETVLITGIGGGVATFCLQFAKALGARVVVTSSSPEKLARALALGADGGFNYRSENWPREVQAKHGAVDLTVDGACGEGYSRLLDLAAPGGRVVNYGATAGTPKRYDIFKVFWKQLHLIGSTMGSPDDFQRMLDLVTTHQLRPVIDRSLPLEAANEALQLMSNSSQFGKLVLSHHR